LTAVPEMFFGIPKMFTGVLEPIVGILEMFFRSSGQVCQDSGSVVKVQRNCLARGVLELLGIVVRKSDYELIFSLLYPNFLIVYKIWVNNRQKTHPSKIFILSNEQGMQ
jgi:hypothetical protein